MRNDLEGKRKIRIHDDNVSKINNFHFKIITLDVLRQIQLKTSFRKSIYLRFLYTRAQITRHIFITTAQPTT